MKKATIEGETVSKGQAIVTYSTKDEASEALKKLPFVTHLGNNVEVDLYITKSGRMREYEIKNNPLR